MAGHYAQAAVCPLLQLTDDELELVGYTICDALRPGIAGSLAAACRHTWQVMRRRRPLAQLQPRHAAARQGDSVHTKLLEKEKESHQHWARLPHY